MLRRGHSEPSGIVSGKSLLGVVQGHPDLPGGGGGKSSVVRAVVIVQPVALVRISCSRSALGVSLVSLTLLERVAIAQLCHIVQPTIMQFGQLL